MRERLNSLSRHLSDRKHADPAPSKGGMSLPLGLENVHRRLSLSGHQNDVREAKRFLKDNVRSDWAYPPLPRFQIPVRPKRAEGDGEEDAHETKDDDDDNDDDVDEDLADKETEGEEHTPVDFRFYNPSDHERDALLHRGPEQLEFEPAAWRERDYSDEEIPDDDDDEGKEKEKEYKFDTPDDIGASLADRALARKRKRQALLDEECTWNDGLAHWLARRDAFCGAHTTAQVQALENTRQPERAGSTSVSATSSSSRSSTDSSETDAALDTTSTPSTTPEVPIDASASDPSIIPTEPPAPPSEILVPVAPPFLASHPVRRRITPDSYSEIYTKIILQGRTPSVPINLQTLTKAMVQGWKDDGEWPPKPIEATWAGTGERRNSVTLKKGVKAVGRALRITSGDGIAER